MVGGSVYDYLHKHRGSMKLPMVLRVACDVAKGMDFLHKNNIIHRDLKTANLLMDENDVSAQGRAGQGRAHCAVPRAEERRGVVDVVTALNKQCSAVLRVGA